MLHIENSPLMLGVTGNMDLRNAELEPLKERVRTLFRFLRSSGTEDERQAKLQALVDLLPPSPEGHPNPYRLGLRDWPSLDQTPILVLTSLAPGADSLIAEVASEHEFCNQDFHVIAPLPFPCDIYDKATTFTRGTRKEPDLEDAGRIETYKHLLDRIGEHRTFCVRMQRDRSLSATAFRAQCEKDLRSREGRRDRYYAAGEYIAAHVHLLIAIWDHKHGADTSVGSGAIVHARQNGHRIGVLPASDGLSQPHGGPIFHLATHREKNPDVSIDPPEFRARFLVPIGSAAEPANEEADLEQQCVSLSLFSRIARNLEQFNSTACPGTPQADRELNKQLSWTSATSPHAQCFSQTLLIKYGKSRLYQGFRKLAVLHRRGDDHSIQLNDKTTRTRRGMFALALLAAALTHLFSEWHVSGDFPHESPSVRPWLGLVGVALAAASILWFWWRSTQRSAERSHDYRALAEGMRVQLFWNLAGLGESVSANYMQRQRGELDWIRGAILAASMPTESWRDRFDDLDKADQVSVLRCVLKNWVQEQAKYFVKSVKKHQRQLHFWHKLGGLAALTGLLGFVLLVISSANSPQEPLAWLQGNLGVGLTWALLTVVASALFAFFRILALQRAGANWLEPYPCAAGQWREQFKCAADRLLHYVVPTKERHTWQPRTKREERKNLLVNFLSFLVPAVPLSLLTATAGAFFAECNPYAPDASIWTSVLLGTWLVLGAMCIAWTEKNSNSELAYQYSTMAPMFRTAQLRLQPLVEQLDAATLSRNGTAYAKALQDIHAILYDIGIQALDENAEWLIMHRARPLEPVMAG